MKAMFTTPCVTPPGPDHPLCHAARPRPSVPNKASHGAVSQGRAPPQRRRPAAGHDHSHLRRLHKSPPPLLGHAEKAQDCEEVQGIPRRAQKRTETRNADSPTYIPRREDTPKEGGAAEGGPLKEPPGATIWQAQRTRERGQRRETLKGLNRLTERGLREAQQKLTHSDKQPQRTPHR